MKRKRKISKPILRRITLSVGGKPVKTVRDYITLPQAVRECGKDQFFGRGDRVLLTRRVAAVRVRIEYVVMEDLTAGGLYREVIESNLSDAVTVIRAGLAG